MAQDVAGQEKQKKMKNGVSRHFKAYDELKKWAWDNANNIHKGKTRPEELLRKMQELVKANGNSRHFADSAIEALIAYHEYLSGNITEESAQIRLRHGKALLWQTHKRS